MPYLSALEVCSRQGAITNPCLPLALPLPLYVIIFYILFRSLGGGVLKAQNTPLVTANTTETRRIRVADCM